MNATTAADGAGTNATNATTTNTTTNRPTVVSPNRDIEENAAPYNDTEPKAPPYNETADNAGTAPLLPTYSFAMRPTPPRTTWRRMTGGLVAERNAEQDTEASKHPGVIRVYFSKTSFLLMQWFFTPWVLGTSAQALHLSGDLPSVVPMLAYLLICAVVHIVAMYYFVHAQFPVSSKDPRPPRWYLISYGVSSLAWAAAMACVVLVEIESHQFRGDRDKEKGLQRCGKSRKCYPSTPNALINTDACIGLAAISCILMNIICHWYQVSKLWRYTFTADEIRTAYEYVPISIWERRLWERPS
ncbi:hypothetical protein V496_05971 [Pseudogymnoascus sp. VKM F-4515 (FW-2607)]|nr:hypothetical protein V496_05971 [Pseudogymnoascus sp. VKM F-4515 (FW-2607)]KFY90403.1 hypothetical protein V498_05997 [Pseudogymnoascus sp. VKM F-4517 (FW-2822)]